MTSPKGGAVGVVSKSEVATTSSGKSYVSTSIKLTEKSFPSGKTYSERIEARDFGRDAQPLEVGSIVSVWGSIQTEAWIGKVDGKAHARVVIVGPVEPVGPVEAGSGDATPARQSVQAPRPPSPPRPSPPPTAEDDVPF